MLALAGRRGGNILRCTSGGCWPGAFCPCPAGISRDSWHKRRATGGKRKALRKKRKFELGRPPANTKVRVAGTSYLPWWALFRMILHLRTSVASQLRVCFAPHSPQVGLKRIHKVRVRGGNTKYRALRLDGGNFAWGSEGERPFSVHCCCPGHFAPGPHPLQR